MSGKTLYYHLVTFIVVVIWGSTFVFTKMLLLSGLSPAVIFTLRFIIAYVLLMGFSLMRNGHRWWCASWRDELLMAGLGVTGGSLYFLVENEALRYTTTTNTSLIVCSCPLFASLLIGWFYRSQRLGRVQMAGMLVAVVGLVLVVMNGHFVLHLSPFQRYNAVFITRKVFFYGLLTIVPYFLWVEPFDVSVLSTMSASVWLNLLYLGIVASMLCFLLWTWVMDKLGAIVATNYVFVNPVSTIIFAWWLLDEPITPWFLLGTLLILAGMYLCDKHGDSVSKSLAE